MSAREAVFDMLKARLDDEHANRCLDAYRAEILREASEKIRKQQHAGHDQIKCVPCFIYGHAADLITP